MPGWPAWRRRTPAGRTRERRRDTPVPCRGGSPRHRRRPGAARRGRRLPQPGRVRPYQGRQAVAPILRAFSRVAEDFRYVREIGSPGAPDHVLLFQARVGSRELEGSDFLHTTSDGLIDELIVMIRPLSAALALAEAMKAQLETQVRRPGGG